MKKSLEERLRYVQNTFGPAGRHCLDHLVPLKHTKARDRQHALELLNQVKSQGGASLWLRED